MHHKKNLALFILLAAAFIPFNFGGCSGRKDPGVSRNKASLDKHSIHIINKDSLSNILTDNKGKVIFINVWATWCEPCVKEFPDIVKIYNEYKNKNISFLSLSVDLKSDIDSVVIPFLKKQSAGLPVYLVDEKSSEAVINYLNPEWSGAIPVTIIYDKKGRREKFLSGAQDYLQLKNSIDSVESL